MRASLRLKLLLLILISVLLPLSISTYMSVSSSGQTIEELSVKFFNVTGDFIKEKISSLIEEKLKSVKEYSGRSSFLTAISINMKEAALGDIGRILREDKNFLSFKLYNMRGNLIATDDESINLPKEVIEKAIASGKEGKPFLSNVLKVDIKEEKFIIALSHPVQSYGILIGILKFSTISELMKGLEEEIKRKTNLQSAYPYVVDLDKSTPIYHPVPENIGKSLKELNLKELEQDLLNKRTVSRYVFQGKEKFVTINYIERDDLKIGIAVGVNLEEILSPLSSLKRRAFLMGGIIAIIFLLIGALIGKGITNPIRELMGLAQRAAKGDLSFFIPRLAKDEIGELCDSLDSMMRSLKGIIGDLTKRSAKLDESSYTLSSICDETARAVSVTSEKIVEITENIKRQTESLHKVLQSLNELNQVVESAYRNAKVTRESSMKAEDASRKIKEASSKVIEGMSEIRREVLSTAEAVKKLGERSREIGKIVDLITNIADQTNLLALNAAIEAARAGEAGRGFAVVAEEVRKLAEASGQAAMQISKLINEIREDTEFAVKKMTESSKVVEKGANLAGEASSAVDAIISAVSETQGFIDQLEEIISKEVETSREIVKTITEVNSKAEETARAIEEVSASAEEITASSEEVASTASELKVISNSIKEIISKFKTEEETRIKEVVT